MPVRLTLEKIKENLKSKNSSIIICSNKYKNKETKLKLRCLRENCNHEWLKKAKMLNGKVICPKCENSRLLSIEKIKAYVTRQGFTFLTAKNLEDAKKCMITIICSRGHEREMSWHSFAHQKCRCKIGLCNITGNKLRKNVMEIVSEIESNNYTIIDGLDDYVNTKSQLTLLCENHHQWTVSYNHFMKIRKCPSCNGYRRTYKYHEVKEIFENAGCTLLESKYINSVTKMKYRCICKNDECYIRLTDFLRGVRCKRCANREPYSFKEIKELFEMRGHTLLAKEYKGVKFKYSYICKCGNISKINISDLLKGNRCMECYLESVRGENHPNYNPSITDEERQIKRKYFEYAHWRLEVFKRDSFTCQCCGDRRGGNLVSHHLDGYDWCIEKRTIISNGITLCKDCHVTFHKEYKFGGNTKTQFDRWLISNIKINNSGYFLNLNSSNSNTD